MVEFAKTMAHYNRGKLSLTYYIAWGILDVTAALLVLFGSLTTFCTLSAAWSSSQLTKAALDSITHTFVRLIVVAMLLQLVSVGLFLGHLVTAVWHGGDAAIRIPWGFMACMLVAGVLIMIRALAKIVEGGLAPDEWVFFGLDSFLMVIASAVMVAGDPVLTWVVRPRARRAEVVDNEANLGRSPIEEEV